MTRRVTPGEPILPHMTAKWFNKTLQEPQQKPLPPGKEERRHNETKATFVPTTEYPVAERFTAVAPVGRVDTYGNRVERAQYVNKEDLTKYNWIVTQLKMAAGYLTQDCVYSGITYAKVNIIDEDHKYVDLNLDTLELESSDTGKGVLLDIGAEYSLISIEILSGGGGASLFGFELTSSMGGKSANADIYELDGIDLGDMIENSTVYDPKDIFGVLVTESTGLCLLQGGKYYIIQANCPITGTTTTNEPTTTTNEPTTTSDEPTTTSGEPTTTTTEPTDTSDEPTTTTSDEPTATSGE